jgi:hypothetical protein
MEICITRFGWTGARMFGEKSCFYPSRLEGLRVFGVHAHLHPSQPLLKLRPT